MFLHLDCRYYLGDRPCKFNRPCEGCPHYAPMGPRVLIVKFGALGDVVRTQALIPGLERLCHEPPFVTWLTSPGAVELVERMPGVHRVWAWGVEARARLDVERFDFMICLDKEASPGSAAMAAQANHKLGFGMSRYGTAYPLNDDAEYFFQLGLDNEEKFHKNRLSYPQLAYEAVGLEYKGEAYRLDLTAADRAAAERRFAGFAGTRSIKRWIGLNPGAGKVFAYKAWREEGYVKLIRELHTHRPDAGFLLLGGAEETDLLGRIANAAGEAPVFSGGTDNTLGEFMGLIDRCDVVVSGDTLAMHLAVARKRRVVAIFGPTCEQEVDLFGRGEKLKSPIECSPCYRRECDKSPTCQDLIPEARVFEAVLGQLGALDGEARTVAGAPA
jgi:ADP-heptose:LPS heptosyltransferase